MVVGAGETRNAQGDKRPEPRRLVNQVNVMLYSSPPAPDGMIDSGIV